MSLHSDFRDVDRLPEGVFAKKRAPSVANDHFATRNGICCAGVHLIIDLHGANPVRLSDEGHIERTFRQCADAAGATVLHIHTHVFEENGGISGVAVLAESHISIHTWPEIGFAALDVFMCGETDIDACIPIWRDAFAPTRVDVQELLRGRTAA